MTRGAVEDLFARKLVVKATQANGKRLERAEWVLVVHGKLVGANAP